MVGKSGLLFTIVLNLFPGCLGGFYYTEWFDRDNPSGICDCETIADIIREKGKWRVCGGEEYVLGAECRRISDQMPVEDIFPPQVYLQGCDERGLFCRNSDNPGGCFDYEVRFLCACITAYTEWFDRDNPSGICDCELVDDHIRDNGAWRVCGGKQYVVDAECLTTSGDPVTQVLQLGCDANGLFCRNTDNLPWGCLDYKVKYECCWPMWIFEDPVFKLAMKNKNKFKLW